MVADRARLLHLAAVVAAAAAAREVGVRLDLALALRLLGGRDLALVRVHERRPPVVADLALGEALAHHAERLAELQQAHRPRPRAAHLERELEPVLRLLQLRVLAARGVLVREVQPHRARRSMPYCWRICAIASRSSSTAPRSGAGSGGSGGCNAPRAALPPHGTEPLERVRAGGSDSSSLSSSEYSSSSSS